MDPISASVMTSRMADMAFMEAVIKYHGGKVIPEQPATGEKQKTV